MDKGTIMFELTRKGYDKFFLTKLPQRLHNKEGKYVFIDTDGKSCKSGYITAYFEDFNRGTRYRGSKLRYEKVVVSGLYPFISCSPRKSTWYLLYYNFKYGDPDTVTLDIVWCFSKYREETVDKYIYNTLYELWKNILQAVKNYNARKYNAGRV